MWWTDKFRSDDGMVGAAAVCKHTDSWRKFHSNPGTAQKEVYDPELWATGLALWESVMNTDTLLTHGVITAAVFCTL